MVEDNDKIFGEVGDSKTAFNSALDIIQRISRLEYSLSSCLLLDDLKNALNLLILIDTEIDFKLKDKERETIKIEFNKIKLRIDQACSVYENQGRMYFRHPKIRNEVKEELIELKKVISRHKYRVGLGMTDQSDPRYALLNG